MKNLIESFLSLIIASLLLMGCTKTDKDSNKYDISYQSIIKVSHLLLMHIVSGIYTPASCAIYLYINILTFPFSVKRLFASLAHLEAAD